MRKMNKPLTAALIAATALSVTACGQTGTASAPIAGITAPDTKAGSTIQVQSTEEIKVVPDMAEISFAVSTQAEDPKACQEKNSEDLNKVIAFLKTAGIDEKSIQTTNYGLEPIYDWNSGQAITGYQMRTSIIVSDIPIDQVGTLLSSSVEAGINNIDNVSYFSSKYDENYQKSLKKAIESARVKAEAIASASGSKLGEISNVEELSNYAVTRYTGYSQTESAPQADAKSMVVEPGQISVEAQISVTYKIQ
ncbi:SIMPL domain-containing protein [Lachnospiraceae bacterium 54-53]